MVSIKYAISFFIIINKFLIYISILCISCTKFARCFYSYCQLPRAFIHILLIIMQFKFNLYLSLLFIPNKRKSGFPTLFSPDLLPFFLENSAIFNAYFQIFMRFLTLFCLVMLHIFINLQLSIIAISSTRF